MSKQKAPPDTDSGPTAPSGATGSASIAARTSWRSPGSTLDERRPEGKRMRASARRILAGLGKGDATAISVADTMKTAEAFASAPGTERLCEWIVTRF